MCNSYFIASTITYPYCNKPNATTTNYFVQLIEYENLNKFNK